MAKAERSKRPKWARDATTPRTAVKPIPIMTMTRMTVVTDRYTRSNMMEITTTVANSDLHGGMIARVTPSLLIALSGR